MSICLSQRDRQIDRYIDTQIDRQNPSLPHKLPTSRKGRVYGKAIVLARVYMYDYYFTTYHIMISIIFMIYICTGAGRVGGNRHTTWWVHVQVHAGVYQLTHLGVLGFERFAVAAPRGIKLNQNCKKACLHEQNGLNWGREGER